MLSKPPPGGAVFGARMLNAAEPQLRAAIADAEFALLSDTRSAYVGRWVLWGIRPALDAVRSVPRECWYAAHRLCGVVRGGPGEQGGDQGFPAFLLVVAPVSLVVGGRVRTR